MRYEVLVEELRGDTLENIHIGIICGVNDRKESSYRVGDIQHPTYFRSAAKPIQALPAFLAGVDIKYGLTDKETALFAASHRGESYHITALEALRKKLSIEENQLFCPYSYPLNDKPKEEMLKRNIKMRKLYHNCSGKHMGFIAACYEMGFPIEGYWQISHPLQQKILKILSYISETPFSEIQVGVDGCGAPIFAIPLQNMAITSLKLACPDLIEDDELREAVVRMTNIMNHEHNMVAADNFICSVLLQDRNVIAKGGARGVYCFGLKEERVGFALKVLNGSEDIWPNIIATILEQIGYKNKNTIQNIRSLRPVTIKSDGGIEVGTIHEALQLQ